MHSINLLICLKVVSSMCCSPITIPNPYLHIGDKGLNFLHDTVNSHIIVPCGKCQQCISLRQSFFNQRVQMESLRSELFMITLTYNSESLPIINVGEYCLAFPCFKDIQNMMKRIRKVLPHPIRYVFCSEYGSRRRRPHFHGIIAVEKSSIVDYYKSSVSLCERELSKLFLKEWRVNCGTSFKPDYKNLCTYRRRGKYCNYDFHHIVNLPNHENDVTFYVSKYVTKYDETIYKLLQKISMDDEIEPEFTSLIISALKPRCTISKDFGSPDYPPIREYINKCILRDELDVPQFYDIYSGQRSLLSRYYRKHCYSIDSALTRFYLSKSDHVLSSHEDDDCSVLDYKHTSDKSKVSFKNVAKIKKHLQRCDFD